jgi:hypothetical protein
MAELAISCVNAGFERYGASPTLMFTLRIASDTRIHAIALRCQIRIEPARRPYADDEAALLLDVFGDRTRWSDTLKPMQFANTGLIVPSFDGSTFVDLPVPVSYDLEVATGKYLHALGGGTVPIVMLFSGTIFGRSDNGFWVEQVPWHVEARYELPITVWQDLMNEYFPGGGWLRLNSATLDALMRYKSERGLATWDETLTSLLPLSHSLSQEAAL